MRVRTNKSVCAYTHRLLIARAHVLNVRWHFDISLIACCHNLNSKLTMMKQSKSAFYSSVHLIPFHLHYPLFSRLFWVQWKCGHFICGVYGGIAISNRAHRHFACCHTTHTTYMKIYLVMSQTMPFFCCVGLVFVKIEIAGIGDGVRTKNGTVRPRDK